jgi:hypothetical protein
VTAQVLKVDNLTTLEGMSPAPCDPAVGCVEPELQLKQGKNQGIVPCRVGLAYYKSIADLDFPPNGVSLRPDLSGNNREIIAGP